MSELLAMSFDCASSPTLKIKFNIGQSEVSGWGFGWFPNDDNAASVVKDTGSRDVSSLTSALTDWRRFRSTTFLCKVKGEAKRYVQQDTQPFQRSYGGRDWLFLHNGELDKIKLSKLILPSRGFLEPIGTTDSELAFCFLLQQIQESGFKRIADIDNTDLINWLVCLDGFGKSDIALSDGQNAIFFHGKNSTGDLFFMRRTPDCNSDDEIEGDSLLIDLGDPQDTYRTSFLVSSVPLNGLGWKKMSPGQMMIVRRGDIVWDSNSKSCIPIARGERKLQAQARQRADTVEPFSSHQIEQAQSGPNASAPKVTNLKSIIQTADGKPLEFRSFKVSHTTNYRYSKEVERSTHILRLQPVEDKTQEILRSTLSFSSKGEQLLYEDVFGNHAMHITVDQPYNHLEIKMESHVKVFATLPDDFNSEMRRTSIPIVWMPWQRQMMLPYLLPLELPEPQLLELTDYAMSFVERNDYNLVDTLVEMNKHIYKDYSYVQGHTTIETTPFDVYTSRKGVCQDFANLYICLTRLLNIPSRYRVGYIHTGANYTNKIQSEASHAWAEVYLPYVGWRGFDPTNGVEVGQEHIRVACGRNFRDATPTAGTLFKGGGTETLSVNVTVEDLVKI